MKSVEPLRNHQQVHPPKNTLKSIKRSTIELEGIVRHQGSGILEQKNMSHVRSVFDQPTKFSHGWFREQQVMYKTYDRNHKERQIYHRKDTMNHSATALKPTQLFCRFKVPHNARHTKKIKPKKSKTAPATRPRAPLQNASSECSSCSAKDMS